MDRFLKNQKNKKPVQNFASAEVICIWGPEGIGKTWLAEKTGGVHLTEDILRSKQTTLDFIERMRTSTQPVIIDDFESVKDLVGLRELSGCPSRAQMFITARFPIKMSFPVMNHEYPVPTSDKIIKIVHFLKPDVDETRLAHLAGQANGSVRRVLQELDFASDQRDFFQEPRKDLEVLFVSGVKGKIPDISSVHEHGFMWAMVQENYADGNITAEQIAEIAGDMTDVDIIDEKIYREQSWNLLPYLAVSAIFKPAFLVEKSLKRMRPGSMWTKFQNECMKKKKVEALRLKYGIIPEYMQYYINLIPAMEPHEISFIKKISSFCK